MNKNSSTGLLILVVIIIIIVCGAIGLKWWLTIAFVVGWWILWQFFVDIFAD